MRALSSSRRKHWPNSPVTRSMYHLAPSDAPAPMPATLTATEIAEAAGFDVSLIRDSLGLSYEERAIQHQGALDLMLEMERLSFLENPDPDVEIKNLYLGTVLGPLDILSSIKGVG